MADTILSSNATEGILTVNGVTALTAKQSGVLSAGADGVSGNDVVTFSQLMSLLIGVNQTWQNFQPSRVNGTIYTNTTGKPIMVSVVLGASTGTSELYVAGQRVAFVIDNTGTSDAQMCAIVPAGATYQTAGVGSVSVWHELR